MRWRSVLPPLALIVVTMVLAEVLLQPAGHQRTDLMLILAAPPAIAAASVPLLRRWVSRRASVAGAALAVGLCSLVLGALSTSAASNAMFVSDHDFRLFLVVLLTSSGIALFVGVELTRPLARDIDRLGMVARRVAFGDLDARSGIDRSDEVGLAAAAIDRMVAELADAERQRRADGEARQHLFTCLGHDLRTPLAAMQAAVESLEGGIAPDPARYLAVLASQLEVVDGMLGQMLEYARIESGHRADVRVNVSLTELADEAVEALAPLAHRQRIDLRVSADGPAVTVGNPDELSRVIRNLVDNAVRHSPQDGTIKVRVRYEDGVVVHVTDEGEGFPETYREHAFVPFTRADPSRNARTGHAGLGLAISRALVEAHGGRIWLGAGPGGDVRIWLPASEGSWA